MQGSPRTPAWAWALAAAVAAGYVLALVVDAGLSTADLAGTASLAAVVICALLLLVRAPRRPVTWAMTVMAAALVVTVLGHVLVPDGTGPVVVRRVLDAAWALTIPMNAVILTLVPDPPTGRWGRRLLAAELVGIALSVVAVLLVGMDGENPVFLVGSAGLVVVLVCLPFAVARLFVLRRRAIGAERAQLGLLLAAGLVVVAVYLIVTGLVGALLGDEVAQSVTATLLVTAVPVAVTVAMVGYGMYGVRLAVNRLLRVTIVVVAASLVAVVVSSLLGRLVPGTSSAPWTVVAATLAALAVAVPLLPLVGRTADALAPADDPSRRLLRGIARRLDTAGADLPTLVVDELVAGLGLDGATIWDADDGAAVAGSGHDSSPRGSGVELRYGAHLVGRLTVDPPADDATRSLLDELAPHVASALEAGRLTRELERSRRRLEVVRDEERARLRRDLHDELSPSLSGMRLSVAAARRRLRGSDEELDGTLARLADETTSSMDVVRRILDDLRPQALDQLGLAGALAARAEALSSDAISMHVDCTASYLPPAVELAAYRVATEAMANAARHSLGARCDVRVDREPDEVVVRVVDDGDGALGAPSGVGTESMRDRTAAVGGRIAVTSVSGGGTCVEARLPVASAP